MTNPREHMTTNPREHVPHLAGCPEIECDTGRGEIYELVRPARVVKDEIGREHVASKARVSVARCTECGAHQVFDDDGRLARAEVARAIAAAAADRRSAR